jgi:hypothetical protein
VRKLSRSDRALMLSAWAEVASAPWVLMGRSSETRSACSAASYGGFCSRCERPILVGQIIRFHRDFPNAVHDGCRAPAVTVRTVRPTSVPESRASRAAAPPQPPLCADCHLEHAGPCW